MELQFLRQRNPDKISTGDLIDVEGHGECMVISIVDPAEAIFVVMAPDGNMISLKYEGVGDPVNQPPSTTTLQ